MNIAGIIGNNNDDEKFINLRNISKRGRIIWMKFYSHGKYKI